MQGIGGAGQLVLGAELMSNPITFIPGAVVFIHGLSNVTQATSGSSNNIAQEMWKAGLGKTGGNIAFWTVDIGSSIRSAMTKTLSTAGRNASNVGLIHFSPNVAGKERLIYSKDFVREIQTTSGMFLFGNDLFVAGKGVIDENK